MGEKIKKIKENKIVKLVWNIIYTLLFLMVVLMLLVVVMQRVSDNTITIGGFRMFIVATGSMEPVYNVGDILIAKEIDADKIKVGDDLVYQGKKGSFSGKVVTHRVQTIEKKEDGNYKIITKGVANTAEDPEIDQTQVYGKIVLKMHLLSFLGRLIRNAYVFYFLVFVPVGILVYKNIKNIINRSQEDDDEDDEEYDDEENDG